MLRYIAKLSQLGKLFDAYIMPGIGHMLVKVEDIAKVAIFMASFLRKNMYEDQ